jgi:hypothetical protein
MLNVDFKIFKSFKFATIALEASRIQEIICGIKYVDFHFQFFRQFISISIALKASKSSHTM